MTHKELPKYDFNILSEEAVKQDAFAHKTHENVAETLSSLITKKDSKGQTVGLEGSWGSGKSTVVSILKSKLEKTDSLYFYFDAWAHEGDPLRRVFLESLIAQIGSNDPDLKTLSEKISNRRKVTKCKTQRHATLPGKILALSMLLVPLGAGIVSGIDYSSLTLKWTGQVNGMFLLGTLLSLMPILTLPVSAAWLHKHEKVGIRDLFKLKNWSFLESNSEDETTQEISENEERSSIEFEGYFKTIMERLFSKNPDYKLVMVIDNLDRINPADTLKIWSTLQTFLQKRNPSNNQASWTNNIWIIVPYDQDGLAKVWDANESDGADETCSQHFLNKCFQLRLEVPKLVLTDWKKFTEDMLKQAVGSWPETDKTDVVNILSLTRENLNDIPTPREIKTYINQVGALRQHAHPIVKTTSIAYYVVHRFLKNMSVDDIRKALLEKKLPAPDHEYLVPSCEMDLAALIFGVDPVTGQQLLLEPSIGEALQNSDGSELKALCEKHTDGFWAVFEHHISRMYLGSTLSYSKAIFDGLWKDYRPKCRGFTDKVKKVKLDFPSARNVNACEAHIHLMVESKNNASKLWPQIIAALKDKFDSDANFDANENVTLLCKIIASFGDTTLSMRQFSGTNVTHWINWAQASRSHGAEMHKWIIPPEPLCKSLAEQIRPGAAIPDGILETVEYCLEAGLRSWDAMVEACKAHLHWNNGTGNKNQISVVSSKILFAIAARDTDRKLNIQTVIDNGRFHNCVYHLQAVGSAAYSALLMAKFHGNELHNIQIPAVVHSAQGVQLMRNFWKTSNPENAKLAWDILSGAHQQQILWELAGNTENKLVGDIILLAITQKDAGLFQINGALPKLCAARVITKGLEGSDEKALRKCFIENSELINEIKSQPNINIPLFSYDLYQVLSQNLDEAGVQNIATQMQHLDKIAWEKALVDDTYLTSLALVIKEKYESFSLGHAYYEALHDFAENWCKGIGKEPSDWQKDSWGELVNVMGNSFRTQFAKNLTITFWHNLGSAPRTFFSENKNHLDLEDVLENGTSMIQSTLEASLQDKGDFERIKMLSDMLQTDKSDVFQVEDHFPDFIKEPFNKIFAATEDEEQKQLLKLIATKFHIPIEEAEEQITKNTGNPTEKKT